jgi:hypothetical protein
VKGRQPFFDQRWKILTVGRTWRNRGGAPKVFPAFSISVILPLCRFALAKGVIQRLAVLLKQT